MIGLFLSVTAIKVLDVLMNREKNQEIKSSVGKGEKEYV